MLENWRPKRKCGHCFSPCLTESSYPAATKPPGMQLKPENQTDSKLCLFHPAKNPKSQHKVLSINTWIVNTITSNGNTPVLLVIRNVLLPFKKKYVHKKKSFSSLIAVSDCKLRTANFALFFRGVSWSYLDCSCGLVSNYVIIIYIGSIEEWPFYLTVPVTFRNVDSFIMGNHNFRVKAAYIVSPLRKVVLFNKSV